ncbi:MAG: M48 family metalloprotease [Armatimonadetes bacterium]|nr:M48 family metalloprotease [Armatimonadota bacterium]MDW8122454.1 M48 family metalloprotease [Armatimonadota bacterium]
MYAQIASNYRWSVFLVLLMILLLGAVGYFVGGFFFGIPPDWAAVGAIVFALVWFLISYYGGKRLILWSSGAQKIAKEDHATLFNVVEEMSIAAGLPMPEIYVIADTAPNAFATGRHPGEAAIAVTAGLLTKLNRDELQGVIAHEMAHIKNHDIKLAMLLAVMVGTITLICDVAWRLLRAGVRAGRRGRGNALFALVAILFALLAPLFASLIRLAVSRRREFLADASAALLTRYPEGLASALEKIDADPEPLEVANRATQHLYIVNPLMKGARQEGGWYEKLFSTHPPTSERVARLRGMVGVSLPAERRASFLPGLPLKEERVSRPVGIPFPLLARLGLPAASVGTISLDRPAPVVAPEAREEPVEPTSLSCPRCREGLRKVSVKGRHLFPCPECGGILVSRQDLKALAQYDHRVLIRLDERFPNWVGYGWALISKKICPRCRKPLAETQFPEFGPAAVDWCAQCDLLWFDDTELSVMAKANASRFKTGEQREGVRL